MREPDCFRELLRTRRRACKCSPLEAGFPSQDSVPVRACIIDWDSRHPGGYTTSPLEAGFPSQSTITAFVQLLALLITCLFYLKRITVPWGGPIWIEPVPVTVRPARRREFAFPFTARPSTVTPPPM